MSSVPSPTSASGDATSRSQYRSTDAGAGPGSIAARRFVDDPHLVMMSRNGSPLAERYRRLRLRLEQATPAGPAPPQVTVITSAAPSEGKTTTATNLALAYAENRKQRTLLVGADLRRPSVSRYIAPRPPIGLAEVLAGGTTLERALLEMSNSRLWVLPEGAPTETPLALLQTDSLAQLIARLRVRFDHIVIDTPPTVPFTDAAVIAAHADGTLLVVRAGSTTKPLVRRARESLSGGRVLGAVLNDVLFTVVDRYFYRYDDYAPERYAYAGKSQARP